MSIENNDQFGCSRALTPSQRSLYESVLDFFLECAGGYLSRKIKIENSIACGFLAESNLYALSIALDTEQILSTENISYKGDIDRSSKRSLVTSFKSGFDLHSIAMRRLLLRATGLTDDLLLEKYLPSRTQSLVKKNFLKRKEKINLKILAILFKSISIGWRLNPVRSRIRNKVAYIHLEPDYLDCFSSTYQVKISNYLRQMESSIEDEILIYSIDDIVSLVVEKAMSDKSLQDLIEELGLCGDRLISIWALLLVVIAPRYLHCAASYKKTSQAVETLLIEKRIQCFMNSGGEFRGEVLLCANICRDLKIPMLIAQTGAIEIYLSSKFLRRWVSKFFFHLCWGFDGGIDNSRRVPSPYLSRLNNFSRVIDALDNCFRRKSRVTRVKCVLFLPALDLEIGVEKGEGFVFSDIPTHRRFEEKFLPLLGSIFGIENLFLRIKGEHIPRYSDQAVDLRIAPNIGSQYRYLGSEFSTSAVVAWGDILITSSPSTVFLEIIASGKPFILLLNELVYAQTSEFRRLIDVLESMGLICKDPHQLFDVYRRVSNPENWQVICESPEMENVRNQYCRYNKDFFKVNARTIKSIIRGGDVLPNL